MDGRGLKSAELSDRESLGTGRVGPFIESDALEIPDPRLVLALCAIALSQLGCPHDFLLITAELRATNVLTDQP